MTACRLVWQAPVAARPPLQSRRFNRLCRRPGRCRKDAQFVGQRGEHRAHSATCWRRRATRWARDWPRLTMRGVGPFGCRLSRNTSLRLGIAGPFSTKLSWRVDISASTHGSSCLSRRRWRHSRGCAPTLTVAESFMRQTRSRRAAGADDPAGNGSDDPRRRRFLHAAGRGVRYQCARHVEPDPPLRLPAPRGVRRCTRHHRACRRHAAGDCGPLGEAFLQMQVLASLVLAEPEFIGLRKSCAIVAA